MYFPDNIANVLFGIHTFGVRRHINDLGLGHQEDIVHQKYRNKKKASKIKKQPHKMVFKYLPSFGLRSPGFGLGKKPDPHWLLGREVK